jgi:LPS-assembly protein
LEQDTLPRKSSHGVLNIIGRLCHYLFARRATVFSAGLLLAASAGAQTEQPPYVFGPTPLPEAARRPRTFKVRPPAQVGEHEVLIQGLKQMKEGEWYRLRGGSRVQTSSFLLKADDIDYNENTGEVVARGNVYLLHFENGEELWADHAEYNLNDEYGKFWDVRGSAKLDVTPRQGLLTTNNPFYFQGKWAEKLKETYILHDGFITDCKMPRPWWILHGPKFTIVPDDHAIGYRSVFRMQHVPIFYFPVIYKPLGKEPRRSGFLTPNLGNSSQRGLMVGAGFYWAINRSYDVGYRAQYFTQRGFAHTVDFRGNPLQKTDFTAYFYGVNDRGLQIGNRLLKEGGYTLELEAHTELPHGFYGQAEFNYLSSYLFRQSFTESYSEAINSEVHSTGFITKQWSSYGLDFVAQRLENFQSLAPDDKIVIRKLPEVDFTGRDRLLWSSLPIWISWEASSGLLSRRQPTLQSANFVQRSDLYPRVTSAWHWKGFSLTPSAALRESYWGQSRSASQVLSKDIHRTAGEADVDLQLPTIERIFNKPPKWLGDKVKHVIEAGATYKYVTGVDDFNSLIRFDATELFSNTNQVEVWITNRIYAKRGDNVNEILSWDLRQDRYFDPTFGGAVTPGWCGQPACRNVVLSSIDLTGYAFLAGPRRYSPVVSDLRMSPKPGLAFTWRSDYDPYLHRFVANSIGSIYGFKKIYSVSIGEDSLRPDPAVAGVANQLNGGFHVGGGTRRGWNVGANGVYDFHVGTLRNIMSQVTYNTDCCGFSVQYGKWNVGNRFDTVFRLSLAVANIGSFGTLRKQEQIF